MGMGPPRLVVPPARPVPAPVRLRSAVPPVSVTLPRTAPAACATVAVPEEEEP